MRSALLVVFSTEALPQTVGKLRTALAETGAPTLGSESALALSGRLAVEALAIFDRMMREAMRAPDEPSGN